MCGICCLINFFLEKVKISNDNLLLNYADVYLRNRGPDSYKYIDLNDIAFCGCVLYQQGSKICVQPLQVEEHIFLFNGDVFMERGNMELSDTEWLLKRILRCKDELDILNVFRDIEGPFSFIYYNQNLKKLWFGRDSLGRNSLLIGKIENKLIVSSVLDKKIGTENVIELPPLGLFCLDIEEHNCFLYPWQNVNLNEIYGNQLISVETFLECNLIIENVINPKWLNLFENNTNSYNFEDILKNFTQSNNAEKLFLELFNYPQITNTCNQLIDLLSQSVKERVQNTPQFCKNCINKKNNMQNCLHPKVGILFSGGLDCTIIAVLADRYIDRSYPIDLINVAFEKIVRPQNQTNKKKKPFVNKEKEYIIDWDVPDRISAKETLKELQIICPERKWNLVEVNVERIELNSLLKSHISNLIYPLTTVLDESLGCSLWFASRGKGILDGNSYESPCRVLLIGSGADEMFGGYTRHRNAFLRENNNPDNVTLKQELELDWIRLPSRNLARDDRVICDNMKTPRSPYLQENFIRFVKNLEPLQKCYHHLEQGIGDKLLLRLSGHKLGLKNCATLKKRALQFGSRIADRKQNAKDVSQNLK